MGHDQLVREVDGIRSLVDALRWAQARTPPAVFVDSVAQDEFTHDVVIQAGPDCFVVLDAS